MNYITIIKDKLIYIPHLTLLVTYIFLIFSIKMSYSYIAAHNHITTRLNNGNFLVFSCDGKFTLDPAFNLYNKTKDISWDNYNENLAHFSEEDGGYILFVSENTHHFLSPYGELLQKQSFSLPYSYYYYFSVIPYSHVNDNYYYYIIYKNDDNNYYFRKYSYCLNTYAIIESTYYSFPANSYKFFTCQLMKNNDNNKCIVCFFATSASSNNYIDCIIFDSESDSKTIQVKQKTTRSDINSFDNIKSAVMTIDGRQKALVCTIINGAKLFCAVYNIKTNAFTEKIIDNIDSCNIDTKYLSVSFFRETEEFIVSFLKTCSSDNIYSIYSFDSTFNYNYFGSLNDLTLGVSCNNYKLFKISNNNYNTHLHSILFSSLTQKYCFVGNINNERIMTLFYINKEINIKNPHELKPSYPLKDILCESHYSSDTNYLEKCTTEYEYVQSKCICDNFNNKTFDFLYNCSKKFPYEIIEENKCVEYCDEQLLENGKCIYSYNRTDISDLITEVPAYDQILNILNNNDPSTLLNDIESLFLSGTINDQLDNITNGGDDIILNNDNSIYQITSTNNQKDNSNINISNIIMDECETILKNKYHINQSVPLLMLKVDTFIEGSKIPVIQYKVYNPLTKEQLDLNLCKDTRIDINIPVSIDENDLYKYNASSDYYNDKCFTSTSDDGTDVPLKYRREDFVKNNMSLCDTDCEYLGYDKKTKKSKCECGVKTKMDLSDQKIDSNKFYENFINTSNINIDIVKCYYLLLDTEYLIKNIGNYIILFVIFIFIIGLIIFYIKGNTTLDTIITSNVKQNITQIQNKTEKEDLNEFKKKEREESSSSMQKIKVISSYTLLKNLIINDYKQNKDNIENKENKEKKENKKNKENKVKKHKTKNKDIVLETKNNNLNNLILQHKIELNDYEMNKLDYKEALKIDKRTYLEYYWSLLKLGHLLIFSFITNNDYNLMIIKICLFFFSFALYYTINALFFDDKTYF